MSVRKRKKIKRQGSIILTNRRNSGQYTATAQRNAKLQADVKADIEALMNGKIRSNKLNFN